MTASLRIYYGASEEVDRIIALRLGWHRGKDEEQDDAEPEAAQVTRRQLASRESSGIRYQRCGGGYRVLRK